MPGDRAQRLVEGDLAIFTGVGGIGGFGVQLASTVGEYLDL